MDELTRLMKTAMVLCATACIALGAAGAALAAASTAPPGPVANALMIVVDP